MYRKAEASGESAAAEEAVSEIASESAGEAGQSAAVDEAAPEKPGESAGEVGEPAAVEETAPQVASESAGEAGEPAPVQEAAPGDSDESPEGFFQGFPSAWKRQQNGNPGGGETIPHGEFFVVPELPLGTIAGLTVALVSLAVFRKGRAR